MTKLSNLPLWKQLFLVSRVIDNQVFTNDEIDYISTYCKTLPIGKGGLFDANPDYTTRDAQVAWISLPSPETQWFYDKLNAAVERHNDYTFNFELSGIPYIQYAEYNTGGHHDFHMDVPFDAPIRIDHNLNEWFRKLTVVILLTEPNVDYGGGEFYLNMSQEKTPVHMPLVKGSVLMFPSFLLHKVDFVTWGIRKTLTTWVLGPKFK